MRDISGVDDSLDARIIEQLNDSSDVFKIVVRIANNADSHGYLPSGCKNAGNVPGVFNGCELCSNLFEDVNAAGAAEPNDVGHSDASAFNLALASLTAQMGGDFVDVGDSCGTKRVAF